MYQDNLKKNSKIFGIKTYIFTGIEKKVIPINILAVENIMPPLTPDQIIKNLLRDYPVEALEFLNEDIIKKYGYPVKINFNIQEVKKSSHFDSRPHLPNPLPLKEKREL